MKPQPRIITSSTQASRKSPTDTPPGDAQKVKEEIFIDTNPEITDESSHTPLSSEVIVPTRIFHHHLHAHEPPRIVQMGPADSDTPNLKQTPKTNLLLHSEQSKLSKEKVKNFASPVSAHPNAKQIDHADRSISTASNDLAPQTSIVHPENDAVVSRNAVIQEPNRTVIMAKNAIIINKNEQSVAPAAAGTSIENSDGTTTENLADPNAPEGAGQPKARRTKDGRTKVSGSGPSKNDGKAPAAGAAGKVKNISVVKTDQKDPKTGLPERGESIIESQEKEEVKDGKKEKKTIVVEHRHGDEGVRHGGTPGSPEAGREVGSTHTPADDTPRHVESPQESPVEVPHDLAPPTVTSPTPRTGSPSTNSSYTTVTPRGAGIENNRSPYSARSLHSAVGGEEYTPTGSFSSYSSYTPTSAHSRLTRGSKVSFSEPLITPKQHVVPHVPYHSAMRSPLSRPQVVGDRVEPGPPSIYSSRPSHRSSTPRGRNLSPSSASTSSTRTKSIASRPRSVHSRAQTPVVRETKDLKTVNRQVQFYTKKPDVVAHMLTVDMRQGLDDAEASKRVGIFGENKLKKEKKVSAFRLFLGQLITSLNIILLIAAAGAIVSAVVEGSYGWIEGVVIAVIIVSNSVIGFSQEYRSAKTLESLMNMFAPEAEVMRNGQRKTIQADQLVPGDVVLLEDGDCVPADLRICEGFNLSIDEAVITGESEPVNKVFEPIKPEEGEALGDRKNMAYMSSVVCGGRGKGLVVRTGEDTELGQIAEKLRTSDKDKKKTHLQQSMTKLGYVLLLCAVALSFIVLAIQVLAVGTDAFGERYTWLYVVALCVAIIPEGLPAILALTLAVGMRQMAKKNAIVRKLGVLESLNWITDICSDKTGTLTEGKMMATMMWTENNYFKVAGSGIIPEGQITEKGGGVVSVETLEVDRTLTLLLYVCSLCNMATLTHQDEEWTATSSPTEIALQVLAYKAGLGKPKLEQEYRYLGEHPFDSNSKRMSVAYEKRDEPVSGDDPVEGRDSEAAPGEASKTYLFMKGSLESVTKFCSYYRDEDGDEVEFDDDIMAMIQDQAEAMAGHGLRVLSMAYKCNFQFDPKGNRDTNDEGSTFLGLVGIMDPPRPQSRPAVEKAHAAGINVYMLTGDHKKTAGSIAKQVNIIENEATDKVMIGSEFENAKVAELPKVVARCNPNTKIKMIDELHSRDRFVCMTGDGVNDAPAIKKSDVGVAMGQNGSEVTKDSADIVLLDDNFGTIIVAIEEGRRVFSNIGKIMLHLLTNSFSLIIVLVFGLIFSFFVDEDVIVFPLSPMQILWLNVITDTPMNCALGFEPATPDIMAHPPRTKGEGLFTIELSVDVLYYGVIAGALSLANFGITLFTSDDGPLDIEDVYGKDIEVAAYRARAVCFVTLTYCMLVQIFNCVHPRNSVLMYRGKNIWLWITVLAGAILVFPTLYIPWVNVYVFLHYHLTWVEWIQVFAAVAIFAILSEVYKIFKRCVMGGYRNGHYLIHLAERTTNSISDMNRLMVLQTERMDPDRKEETEIELI
mmetsp:Transcript_2705/g.10388  ORF Transcript_2705/g.10388 Transcript_2705/m.10388 type:complete len:1527 (-) Transcript_2705:446-5026(-)